MVGSLTSYDLIHERKLAFSNMLLCFCEVLGPILTPHRDYNHPVISNHCIFSECNLVMVILNLDH